MTLTQVLPLIQPQLNSTLSQLNPISIQLNSAISQKRISGPPPPPPHPFKMEQNSKVWYKAVIEVNYLDYLYSGGLLAHGKRKLILRFEK